MPTPPDTILLLRFDEQGIPSISGQKNHHAFVGNQELKIEVHVEKLNDAALPPGFSAFNITGWAGSWVAKADLADADVDKKWDVAGAIVGDPLNGKILFTVPKASVDFQVQFGYSEFVFNTGGDTNIRVPFTFTISKPVLAT